MLRLLPLLAVIAPAFAAAGAGDPSASVRNPDAPTAVVLDVRDFGAIGDGRLRPITEWKDERGRAMSARAVRRKYDFVDSDAWSVDELAFELAKRALPPEGGTIHFPAGHYVTGRHAWRIWRNGVRLTGDGAEATTLSTAPDIADALSVSPYRHVGWREGAKREIVFTADSGARGDGSVRLRHPDAAADLTPGQLVFVRNGACRFDQDYGEFNEIAGVDPTGVVRLVHPLSRDYRLDRVNWAAETAEDFVLPRRNRSVTVAVRTGEGYFVPRAGTTVSLGENLFRVESAKAGELRLSNDGQHNDSPGTVVPAGTKIAKSRSIIVLTRSSRDFRCENLKIVGRRKILNLSNSYDLEFRDCVFVRDSRESEFSGGLTIDGDGGRFARFERCTIVATPAIGMQFARSFGGVRFFQCSFTDTNAAFTEFNFDCEVAESTFQVHGTKALTSVVIAGKSCGDVRLLDNRIRASGVAWIVDTVSDIHSQKQASEGRVIVRGNDIEVSDVQGVFQPAPAGRFEIAGNRIDRL